MKRRQITRWSPPVTEVESDDDVVRNRCCMDLKFLFQQILNHGNPEFQDSIGFIHDLLCDFLRYEEDIPEKYRYTCLSEIISDLEEGQEAWIYWPVLYKKTSDGLVYKKPEVYIGRDHQLYKDWIEHKLIKGVLVRIAGVGKWKMVLYPRDHLKSTFGRAEVLQDIIRDNATQTMYRTSEAPLAEQFVSAVKYQFDSNPEFRKYYAQLKPEYKTDVWAKSAIQVVSEVRRGIDPTLWAAAMTTDVTGFHPRKGVFDDIVTPKNLSMQDQIWKKFEQFAFVLARGHGQIRGYGTRYSDNDCWGRMVMPSGEPDSEMQVFDMMSFIYATLRDCDNNLIWPEGYTDDDEKEKRAWCKSDHEWMSQMYNNPYMHSNRTLKDEFREWYEATPESVAENLQLDIAITVDPAHTAGKDSDYTAIMVQGQTPDRRKRYVLDGIREKLNEAELPVRAMDLIEKWQKIAFKYGGTFKIGIESVTYQGYIRFPLRDEARTRMISLPDIILIKPLSRSKQSRINALVHPYSKHVIVWPRKLPKVSYKGNNYDFIWDCLYPEFSKWPNPQAHDDVLDVQAYAEDLFSPMLFPEVRIDAPIKRDDEPIVFKETPNLRSDSQEDDTQGMYVREEDRVMPDVYIPAHMRSRQ